MLKLKKRSAVRRGSLHLMAVMESTRDVPEVDISCQRSSVMRQTAKSRSLGTGSCSREAVAFSPLQVWRILPREGTEAVITAESNVSWRARAASLFRHLGYAQVTRAAQTYVERDYHSARARTMRVDTPSVRLCSPSGRLLRHAAQPFNAVTRPPDDAYAR